MMELHSKAVAACRRQSHEELHAGEDWHMPLTNLHPIRLLLVCLGWRKTHVQ